ncbi:SDR family NAD(P)-dependent oxidoreductase [Rhodopirellula halodulae]|uniref:SDR family NAD(P)-dependent oxidoreductase n=1 Tax=Rhodopirellula halodulae TaxID=2894198 RepID=UPI001E48F5E7|nr:SDR family oxidoreductase [Rhodopirellula sp. JC737]MCC9657730.1 SDR family oxidoreductase [Rhodopirellula sp. JC737]
MPSDPTQPPADPFAFRPDGFRLDGRRIVLTGGTQGVGAAIARGVTLAGADVVLIGLRRDAAAEATLDACRQTGRRAELLLADLSEPPTIWLDDLMRQIDAVLPGCDTLINNAGTFIDVPYLEMTAERYEKTMNLNVSAGYFLTQAFAKRWVADSNAGRVLFTGSINGFLAEPDHTAYDTSKGAVAAMVRSLCVSLAPLGIRVNSMAPGLVRTPLTDIVNQDRKVESWMQAHTPNGQVPSPDACVGAAIFLISDVAEHVHGQTLLVDGGMSTWQQPDPPPT